MQESSAALWLAQLAGEAVGRVHGGSVVDLRAANGLAECGMLAHQGDGSGPRREHVERPDQGHADHRPNGLVGASSPTRRLKVGHQCGYLGRGEKAPDLVNAQGRYRGLGHWSYYLLGHDPGRRQPSGSFIVYLLPPILEGGVTADRHFVSGERPVADIAADLNIEGGDVGAPVVGRWV